MKRKFEYKHTIYASYLGYVTQAIVNNLAPLLFLIFQNSFNIPLEKITLLITINFLVQLLVDLLSAKFVDKIGYRTCIVAAHFFSSAGLVGLALFPRFFKNLSGVFFENGSENVIYIGLIFSVVLYAIGGGLIEVLVSPIVEACPTENKASAMSLLHSFYCWGSVLVIFLSTIFLFTFKKQSWPWLVCLWALLPFANAFFFIKVPIAQLTEEGRGMSFKELFSSKTFWVFIVLMITAGASELAMSQWASAFAESGLGVSKMVGDLSGPCFFAIMMGSARVFYAKFGERISLLRFIIASGILCVFAYMLASFSPIPILSLVGCGMCGLSVGIMWPGVFSLASARFPKGGTAMFALLALAGDLGCSSGPTLVGMVSGVLGDNLKTGLVVGIVFPLILVICCTGFAKNRYHKNGGRYTK